MRNRSRIKIFLLQAILSCFSSMFRKSYTTQAIQIGLMLYTTLAISLKSHKHCHICTQIESSPTQLQTSPYTAAGITHTVSRHHSSQHMTSLNAGVTIHSYRRHPCSASGIIPTHAATDITELCYSVQASILLFIAVGNRHPHITHPTQLQILLYTLMGIIIQSCAHNWQSYRHHTVNRTTSSVMDRGRHQNLYNVIAITLCYIFVLLHNASTLRRKVITSYSFCSGVIGIVIALR